MKILFDPESIKAVRDKIVPGLSAVAAGRSLFPAEITLKLAEAVEQPELTSRERQVLGL